MGSTANAWRAGIQEAAGAEFAPGARISGDDAKQHQRRRAAHDGIELALNLRGIGPLQRCNA